MDKKFWQSTRGKAIIKLSIWVIFILIVFLIGSLNSKPVSKPQENTNDNETNEDATDKEEIPTDILDLSNKDYEYAYKITLQEQDYYIHGQVNQDGEFGYKETQTGTIKYEKIDNMVYQVNLEEKTEITNFYEGLNAEFLDYPALSTILSEYNCHSEVCNFSYNNYLIEINKLTNDSFKINISNDLEKYELTYQNITARD